MGVLMKCGHSANALDEKGNFVCAICLGVGTGATEVASESPNLTGRKARCVCNCGKEEDSSVDLAFFEYCGEGSPNAKLCKHCHVVEKAHGVEGTTACDNYEPIGDIGYDKFYCGCRGWD